MELKHVQSLALLAGLGECKFEEIVNGYWPFHPDYAEMRKLHPWWRITTTFGTIVVGRRKKVFNIDWSGTNRRGEVTKDDVSKDDTFVHAWNIGDVVKYLHDIPSLPIVDVTLPDFKSYDCTKFSDVDMLVRRFTDATKIEHKLMIQMLESVNPDLTPVRLTLSNRNGESKKGLFVLHIGELRIEWLTERVV